MRNLDKLLEPIRAESGVPALAAGVIERGKLVALGAVGRRRADHEDPVQAVNAVRRALEILRQS